MATAAKTYLGVSLIPSLLHSAEISPTSKAKHVIYLYMSGGMSHLDTFDPKDAKSVMGETKPIGTSADGIRVGHWLPETAKQMDKVCVVNSLRSTQGAHEQGTYTMHTSYNMLGTIRHPSLGSWVTKLGGRLHPELPPFVSINSNPEYTGGGFFGAKFAAAPIGNPNDGLQDSKRVGVDETNFSRRLSLADRMNAKFHEKYPNQDVESYTDLYKEAVKLMNSKDLAAFDLNEESVATKELYGTTRFGLGCLLARRLIQHDVRFVEVQLGGWDTHYDNFAGIETRCKEFDKAFAALLHDLEATGKLKDTLVVVATEFGRTPTLVAEHQVGRDHHPGAFTCLFAGGGIKGGTVYGKTDKEGRKVIENPVTIQDFNATIGYALGLPYDLVLMSPSKRPFKMNGADSAAGKPIVSLFG